MNEPAEFPDTPAALIDAARPIFATQGFDGASVRAITAAAGANLGAITYHFGSKRELYDRVVASIVTPLAERVERVVAGDGPVLDRAGEVVTAYFEYLRTNRDLPQLMMQELVLSGVPPAAIADPMRRVLGALSSLIVEGQESGVVRAGPAAVMSIFILSVPVHLSMMRPALEKVGGVALGDAATFERVVASAREFVQAGLGVEGGA
ncbi:MAG TPA: TetR/AcrR family transcriptional regulator [Longimicrobiales bacterium]|nr:TetR/AcrR family transcriptional regulator [Longimicrobiales bacterium]